MERVQSLINRLYQQSAARASVADLLATTELLYKELAKHGTTQIAANIGSVAVWLPKGFGQAEPNNISWPAPITSVVANPVVEKDIYTAPAVVVERPVVRAEPEPVVEVVAPVAVVVEKDIYTAPAVVVERPEVKAEPEPVVAVAAPVVSIEAAPVLPERAIPLPTVNETPTVAAPPANLPHAEALKEEYPLVFQLDVEPSDEEIDAALAAEKKKQEEAEAWHRAEAEARLVEAEETQEPPKPFAPPVAEKPKVTKPFPGYPDIADVMKKVFPVAPSPIPVKREVNELVADPGAAALNEKLPARGKEVADVLATSGGKITDIRKAISINEKYQMISSLFRGDEDMFERSVRTLNNFGSLPEARFWMQRELVVKMGWNDEDELVQSFYRLVSRRFS